MQQRKLNYYLEATGQQMFQKIDEAITHIYTILLAEGNMVQQTKHRREVLSLINQPLHKENGKGR